MFASSDMQVSESLPYVWLAAFGLAVTLVLVGVACQVLRLGRMSRASWLIWTGLSWLVVAVCVAAAYECMDGWLTGSIGLLAKAGFIAVVALGGCGLFAFRAEKPSAARAGWRMSWGLIAVNGLAAIWASGSFYQSVAPVEEVPNLPSGIAVDWVKIDGAHAYTDRGHAVDLLRFERAGGEPSGFPDIYAHRVIQVADSDHRANCHGWVFAAGRFAVSGADVDTILGDNQYEVVRQPHRGDLIVYRSTSGEILHSGIVRTAEKDLILIESKWGGSARYLHQPCDQPYSTSYKFYRSPRGGHLLDCEAEAFAASDHGRGAEMNAPPRREHAVSTSAAAAAKQSPFALPTVGLPSPLARRS